MTVLRLAPAALIATLLACNSIFAVDELRFDAADGTTAAADGGGGGGAEANGPGSGGDMTAAAGGKGGAGGVGGEGKGGEGAAGNQGGSAQGGAGQGGSGGGVPGLVDAGLVARYFLDEADSGQAAPLAEDSGPHAFDLPIQYGPALSYTELNGNRALAWNDLGSPACPLDFLDARLVAALQSQQLTIEAVVAATAVNSNSLGSVVLSFDGPTDSDATGLRILPTQLLFRWDGAPARYASTNVVGVGRVVLHAVVDTSLAEPERVAFFVDGVGVPSAPAGAAPTGETAVSLSHALVLGNSQFYDRNFVGQLYYAAIYATALTSAEVSHNAALLSANDDE